MSGITFEFAAPRRVLFGRGRLVEAGPAAMARGRRCLVFRGGDPSRSQPVEEYLRQNGVDFDVIHHRGEPTFDQVRDYTQTAETFRPDSIVAIGGGSVIDAAKATAMLSTNGGDPLDYAEVIGGGRPIARSSLPWIAIPTTAGAGAEATRNAVLKSTDHHVKVSLRSPLMFPELVIIDPETTTSLPPITTAATGMDALSQLIEPFVSVKANPITDALCRAGIPLIARSLEQACTHPKDLDAREDLSLAAWWSGMALANAGLGAVHGFAAALGGMTDAPHGLICARFLMLVWRANVETLRRQNELHPVLEKYAEISRMLTNRSDASPLDGLSWLEQMVNRLPLPSLSLAPSMLDSVIETTKQSSSMKGNPIPLSDVQLREITLGIL